MATKKHSGTAAADDINLQHGAESSAQPAVYDEVRHERDSWGDTYIASKAALIAAGRAQDGQFPGDPGRGSTSCSYTENGEPVRRGRAAREKVLSITRYGKLFKVWVAVDKQEGERRRAAEAQAAEWREKAVEWRKKAAEADAEIKREADKLAELPATGEDYAERAAQLFWASFHVFWNRYGGSKPDASGYSFTPEDREIKAPAPQRLSPRISVYSAAAIRSWIAERCAPEPHHGNQKREPSLRVTGGGVQ